MIKRNAIRALKIYHLIQKDVLFSVKTDATTKKAGDTPKEFNYKNDFSNISFKSSLLIYNSKRDSEEEIFFKFNQTLKDFKKSYHTIHLIDLNGNLKNKLVLNILYQFLFNFKYSFKTITKNLKDLKYAFLLLGSERFILSKKIDTVLFFTSNSITVETFRISAIDNNINTIEFLHGISTSRFSKYYWLLNILSKDSKSENFYINLQMKLPQPHFIKQKLLHINDSEYIPKTFKKDTKQIKNIVVIIGGCVGKNFRDYMKTNFFLNEYKTIEYLNENRTEFLYCGHPSLMQEPREFFKIDNNKFSCGIKNLEIIDCLVIGHYSTAVFELAEHNRIFLFNEALNHLGPEFNNLINHPSITLGSYEDLRINLHA
tara:strand:+ start:5379 stop:6494 length:1116 start_codon:yes stop_codon:yes gene_type:complete